MATKRYGEPEKGMDNKTSNLFQAIVLAVAALIVFGFGGFVVWGVVSAARNAPPPTVRVEMVRAKLNQGGFLSGKSLGVVLKISNRSETKRAIWNDLDAVLLYSGLSLRDELGNEYKVVTGTARTAIDPGTSMEVEVEFEVPIQKATQFTVTIPPSLTGSSQGGESFQFGRPPEK